MLMDKIINSLHINGTLLYLTQYGSHLYGTNTENSDLDFRGVYIPTIDDLILHKDKDEINEELTLFEIRDEYNKNPVIYTKEPKTLISSWHLKQIKVDIKIFSLQKFIKLCSKADTNALDLLFSYNPERKDIQQYVYNKEQYYENGILAHPYIPFIEFLINRGKLINTDRLESPITYAFKQATKYSIKGERRQVMLNLLKHVNTYLFLDTTPADVPLSRFMTDFIYEDGTPVINQYIDGKHVKIDELDNKGKKEKYLYVCGVQHQFNLELKRFAQRLEEKINKEYTSQRTIDAADGNDWKALSHAIRVLFEIKQLLETGDIQFPVDPIVKQIKLGQISREDIDNLFDTTFQDMMEQIKQNALDWKYDEDFWNNFILEQTKFVNKECSNEN